MGKNVFILISSVLWSITGCSDEFFDEGVIKLTQIKIMNYTNISYDYFELDVGYMENEEFIITQSRKFDIKVKSNEAMDAIHHNGEKFSYKSVNLEASPWNIDSNPICGASEYGVFLFKLPDGRKLLLNVFRCSYAIGFTKIEMTILEDKLVQYLY